jgi:hypothetical protein
MPDLACSQNVEWFKTLLPVAIALLSAFLSGYFFARYKSREDQIDKRCDEICVEIVSVGNASSLYWLEPNLARVENNMQQVKIVAGWSRISGLRVLLEEFVSETAKSELVDAEMKMFSVTTGSNFGGMNVAAEPQRARESILEAANYVNTVRMARMRDTKGHLRRS